MRVVVLPGVASCFDDGSIASVAPPQPPPPHGVVPRRLTL